MSNGWNFILAALGGCVASSSGSAYAVWKIYQRVKDLPVKVALPQLATDAAYALCQFCGRTVAKYEKTSDGAVKCHNCQAEGK